VSVVDDEDHLLDGGELDAREDPALDGFLHDVTAFVEDDVVRANVPWDFAAVLARAHALDPSVVSAQAVAEAEQAEPVISLAQRRSQRVTRDDPELASLVEDVRAANEHDAALRMAAAAGAAPRRATSGATTGRVVALVLALAAALVVGFGVVRGVQVLTEQTDASADAAVHQGGPSGEAPERAVIDDGAPQKTVSVTPRAPAIAPPETIAPPPDAILEAPVATARVSKKVPRPAKAATPTEPAPREPSLTERLAALDGEAHAAWKSGDFAKAEEKFEDLIALAGTSRLADLAYGDLFTLARRRGDSKREVALWKRYLAAFGTGSARGRFADDARAGLCRKSASDKPACWRDYLADFPEGSYRAQAERESGSAP
jgi:hypothetical protein